MKHTRLALSNGKTYLTVIQTIEIQLIGSHSNCSSNGNFIIYHTLNFVTEWLYNKLTMPYYKEKEHILRLPSQARLPALNVKNGEDNLLFNRSLEYNMDDKDILDIDSWFDEDTESSMIFICISCIIVLVAFIVLIFLCFKQEKP